MTASHLDIGASPKFHLRTVRTPTQPSLKGPRSDWSLSISLHNGSVDRSDSCAGLERRVRLLLTGFVVGLVVSGVTAFPLPAEVAMLSHWLGARDGAGEYGGLLRWIVQVREGLLTTESRFPFLFYGTDWLAFGHLVIAMAFIGPIRDPVRNVWVVEWGMLACVAVIPLALICGPIRGIPIQWQLIDCSFGVVGIVPLAICLHAIRKLERAAAVGRVSRL